MFNHCLSIEYCQPEPIFPHRTRQTMAEPECSSSKINCDDWPSKSREALWHDALHFDTVYQWIAEQVGFWPLFLSLGDTIDDLQMTGYQNNWFRPKEYDELTQKSSYRPGSQVNQALFRWNHPPAQSVYMDYVYYHIALNSVKYDGDNMHNSTFIPISTYTHKLIWKPSYGVSQWKRFGEKHPGSVQVICPSLDLSTADIICCRNKTSKKLLVSRGFMEDKIRILRIPLN
jgi:hypothetical protein